MSNKRRDRYKKKSQVHTFEPLTIEAFETFCAVALNQMVTNDKFSPSAPDFGVKTFTESGIQDQGHGCVVRCKDGTKFILDITQVL
jgi:hypothetical protein